MLAKIQTEPACAVTGNYTDGLFRMALVGADHTLVDAFANLKHTPRANQVSRHPSRDLVGARMALAPEEGEVTGNL